MNAKLESLVNRYTAARTVFENAQLGPRTDKAQARMEAIVAQAEKLGLLPELTAELGY